MINPDTDLPDPFWAMAVKQRDHYCCVACGSKHHPQAYHLTPRGEGGPNTLNNGTTLCAACHRRLQGGTAAVPGARHGLWPTPKRPRATPVRLAPALLRTARVYLATEGVSVTAFLTQSLQRYVEEYAPPALRLPPSQPGVPGVAAGQLTVSPTWHRSVHGFAVRLSQ